MPEWSIGLLLFLKDLALGIYLTFFTGRWIQWLDIRAQAQRAVARIQKRVGETSTDLPLRAWAPLSKSLVAELDELADILARRGHLAAAEQVIEVANEITNQVLSFYSTETNRLMHFTSGASVDQMTARMMIVTESTDAAVSVRWETANWLDRERKHHLEARLGEISPSVPVILLLPGAEKIDRSLIRFRRYFFETGEWQ